MSRYRKKPVEIEAVQWLGPETPHPEVREYTDAEAPVGEPGRFYVNTLEGPLRVSPGDYIIRGVKGEFYPCKPDIFAATYEPVAPPGAEQEPESEQEEWLADLDRWLDEFEQCVRDVERFGHPSDDQRLAEARRQVRATARPLRSAGQPGGDKTI